MSATVTLLQRKSIELCWNRSILHFTRRRRSVRCRRIRHQSRRPVSLVRSPGDQTDRHSPCSAPREEQAERATQRDAELEKRYMTAEKLESPLDPLLAALANFHSSADLSAKVAACLMRACFIRIKVIAGVSLRADPRAFSPHRRQRQRLRRL